MWLITLSATRHSYPHCRECARLARLYMTDLKRSGSATRSRGYEISLRTQVCHQATPENRDLSRCLLVASAYVTENPSFLTAPSSSNGVLESLHVHIDLHTTRE